MLLFQDAVKDVLVFDPVLNHVLRLYVVADPENIEKGAVPVSDKSQ